MSITNAGGSFGKAGRAVADKFGKTEGGGTGGAAKKSITQPRDPAGPKGAISGGSAEGPGAKSYSRQSDTGGGTTTQLSPSPGAVPNFPEADTATVFEKIFAPLIPGVGGALGIQTAANALAGDSTTTVLGGDPGPQRGYQPDRYRGAASLGGIGGDGGAVNDDEREIAGRSFGAGTAALTGDDEGGDAGADPGPGGDYSDVTLRDRRKPRVGAGTQMLLG